MVKKLGILGFILVAVCAAGMVWAGTYSGAIPAPQPTVMPASAPACVGPNCNPPTMTLPAAPKPMKPNKNMFQQTTNPPQQSCAPAVATQKMVPEPCKNLATSIKVKMKYPMPEPPPFFQPAGCGPPPIPVAVPMWKFIVPWPPFVYYLPVE